MVQILKPQMRNYQADQTEAIKQQQTTQFISDVGGVVQGVANVYNAFQKGAENRLQKAEEADQNIIDTEIGEQGATALMQFNVDSIGAGTDVSGEEYSKALQTRADEIYQPLVDRMQTEKGKNKLLSQKRKALDKLMQANIGKVATLQKSAQAQTSAQKLSGAMQNDAFEFGKIGDFESFMDGSSENRTALVDYMESQGTPREVAEAQIDMANAEGFLLGQAESDPESILGAFDSGVLKAEIEKKLKQAQPNLDDKLIKESADAYVKKIYAGKGDEITGVAGDAVIGLYKESFIKNAEAQKVALQAELKLHDKKSPAYRSIQQQIKEVDDSIANADEEAKNAVKDYFKNKLLPIAEAQYKKNQVAQQEYDEKNLIETYATTLSPDIRESVNAQTNITKLQEQYIDSYKPKLKAGVVAQFKELKKAYDDFESKKGNVKEQLQSTFEGTTAMVDAIKNVYKPDSRSDLEVMTDVFKASAVIQEAPITQKQADQAQTILYAAARDRVFGDLINQTLNNADKYYPDLSFIETYWSGDNKDTTGTIIGGKPMQNVDIDVTRRALNVQIEEVYKNAIAGIAGASQLPQAERAKALEQVGKYIVDEKKKIYSNIMANYGININELREAKNTKGYAYTKIGSRVKEFKGELDNGTPIFADVIDKTAVNALRDRLMSNLGQNNKKD